MVNIPLDSSCVCPYKSSFHLALVRSRNVGRTVVTPQKW